MSWWPWLLGVDDPAAERDVDGRRAFADLQLREDVLQVDLDRLLADPQQRRDLLVPPPFIHELHHLHLARGEGRVTRALVQPGFDVRPDRTPAGVDLAHEA